ncbi:MAG: pilus assembly protein PilM [Planctomycetota bacterium]
MAKSVGVDSGAFELKIVELDGSFRRPKLSKVCLEPAETAGPDEDPEQVRAVQIREVLKEGGLQRDNLAMAACGRDVLLRELKVPFVGKEQIRRVIKFEAESEIHSHSVDDLVVDFHVFEELESETRVLVAGLPKTVIEARMKALESAHLDPERMDLDLMALYRVAEWAGCFGEEVAQAAVEAAEAEAEDGESDGEVLPTTLGAAVPGLGVQARVVADVGASATRVLAVAGGELLDLRALRIGTDSLVQEIANACSIKLTAARAAVQKVFDDGEDVVIADSDVVASAPTDEVVAESREDDEFVLVDDSDAPPVPDANDSSVAAPTSSQVVVTREIVATAKDRFLMRLRRELLRFSTGLSRVASVERVFVTGGGSLMPGVQAVFSEVFSASAEPLDVLTRLAHDLDDEEAASIGPRLPIAVGLALGQLGGRGGFDFRREEFAFKRKFEQLKFPAAIACLLLILVPVFFIVRRNQQINQLETEHARTHSFEVSSGGRGGESKVEATYYGLLGHLVNRGFPVYEALEGENRDKVLRQVEGAETFDRLLVLRSALRRALEAEQSRTGIFSDLQLRSGAYVLNWFAQQIHDSEEMLGKFLIMRIDLDLESESERQPSKLVVKFMLQGDNYREREASLRARFESRFDDPSCPFSNVAEQRGEDPLQAGVPGAVLQWQFSIKNDFRADGGDA